MSPSALTTGSLVALTTVAAMTRRRAYPMRVRALLGPARRDRDRWLPWRRAAESVGGRIRRLGSRPPDPRADRVLGAALLVGAPLALVQPWFGVAVGALAWIVPMVRSRQREQERRRMVRDALPDVVELFRVAIGAGLTVHLAVEAVAPRVEPPFAGALAEVRRQVALGVRLAEALPLLLELGDPVRGLVVALIGSERDGTPLVPALERVAAEARMLRRRSAEEEARRLPVQLLFPLVVCILPAFGLLTVVPLLGGAVRSLSW